MSFEVPTDLHEPLADLGRFLLALGPYRDEAVLAGGMVPIIYRHLQPASTTLQTPLTTFDLDIALPQELPFIESIELKVLLSRSGFDEYPRGVDHPPAIVYQHTRHGKALGPVYVELLAPLVGKATTRGGSEKRLAEVQPGITAQALRYLDLLLVGPVAVECKRVPLLGVTDPRVMMRVPHPAMYVMQKVLCRDTRRRSKQDKDLAYIFDVVTVFRKKWDEMGRVTHAVASQNVKFEKWLERACHRFAHLFETPTSGGPVAVCRVFGTMGEARGPTEEAVYRVVNRFLDVAKLRR